MSCPHASYCKYMLSPHGRNLKPHHEDLYAFRNSWENSLCEFNVSVHHGVEHTMWLDMVELQKVSRKPRKKHCDKCTSIPSASRKAFKAPIWYVTIAFASSGVIFIQRRPKPWRSINRYKISQRLLQRLLWEGSFYREGLDGRQPWSHTFSPFERFLALQEDRCEQ